ncbi:pilus assembly protein FimT [Methylococcaceae bacterium WWC4]|nr:pilus assembly protein FimT [Methylococcaceae bacterium WWC4]
MIELMITLTIAGILSAIAIPSFISAVRNSRLTGATNQFVAALNYARSEAIKRGQYVVVRKTGTNWESGWQTFVDVDRSGSNANVFNDDNTAPLCEADEDCLLRVYDALPTGFTLRGNGTVADYIYFKASGESKNGSFAICDNADGNDAAEAGTARLVVVTMVGRVRLGEDLDNNNIPDDLDSCSSP